MHVYVYKYVCIYVRVYIYIIYIYKYVKLAIVVEGEPKAPFSIGTTPKCKGGRYSYTRIAYLYPRSVLYNAKGYARRHQVLFFESLV